MSYPRAYPCRDCKQRFTATRPDTRCSACQVLRRAERTAYQRLLDQKARKSARHLSDALPVVRVPKVLLAKAIDLNIQRYRAEKARRAEHRAQALAELQAELARVVALTKPKAGRPRRGYNRNDFGRSVA